MRHSSRGLKTSRPPPRAAGEPGATGLDRKSGRRSEQARTDLLSLQDEHLRVTDERPPSRGQHNRGSAGAGARFRDFARRTLGLGPALLGAAPRPGSPAIQGRRVRPAFPAIAGRTASAADESADGEEHVRRHSPVETRIRALRLRPELTSAHVLGHARYLTCSRAARSPSSSPSSIAAMFSSRCATELVPGISSIRS